MIEIREIRETPVGLFGPNNDYIGVVETYLSFADIRLQIKAQQLEGYYVMFGNKKITIDKNGHASHWPDGFFDHFDKQLSLLLW